MQRPPVIDVFALRDAGSSPEARLATAREIDAAAGRWGFFYVANHGVDAQLVNETVRQARAFFAQDEKQKLRIPMAAGGTAWRGFFPTGGELTSGRPDWKEGLYWAASCPRTIHACATA